MVPGALLPGPDDAGNESVDVPADVFDAAGSSSSPPHAAKVTATTTRSGPESRGRNDLRSCMGGPCLLCGSGGQTHDDAIGGAARLGVFNSEHVDHRYAPSAMSVWQEVGEGCFRRRYDSFDLNIGVVRGIDALCVFDTRCHAIEADALLDELAELGRSRIRWVVNSHWHFDHTFGNARFRDRHPGVEIWGSRAMRDELLELGELSRANWQQRMPEWTELLGDVEIVPPDHLFDDVASIDLGDRLVELRRFGRGHTAGDIVAFVSDADVVYVGDVVEEGAPRIQPGLVSTRMAGVEHVVARPHRFRHGGDPGTRRHRRPDICQRAARRPR